MNQGIDEYDESILDILHDYSYEYLSSILRETENKLNGSCKETDP